MGWDGAGSYVRQHNFSADASSGINILAARMDVEFNDFASAMTLAWARNGQNVPTQDMPMGGRKFVNVGAPTSVSNFMRVREFIENVPIFMQDVESSADRISVSSQYFTSVSANQAPADGTKIMVRVNSNKSSAVMYLDGHSANVEYQDGNRIGAALVSGGIYEFTYSSVDTAWILPTPDDGRTAAEIAAGVTPTNYQHPELTVNRYGTNAVPGTTDMTTAIQAAFDVMGQIGGGIEGGSVKFLDEHYLISSRVAVPAKAGFHVSGESRTGTVVIQDADNEPHFLFDEELSSGIGSHSFTFERMKLTWTNQQTTSDTRSCGFYFEGATNPSTVDYFNFVLQEINFSNGYYLLGGNTAKRYQTWGWTMRNVTFQGDVVGGVYKVLPAVAIGAPNIRLEHVYALCNDMDGPIFNGNALLDAQFDNIELNAVNSDAQILFDEGGGHYDIGSLRIENGVWTATTPLFDTLNSILRIRRFFWGGNQAHTVAAGTGSSPWIFLTGGADGRLWIGTLGLVPTAITGGTYYLVASDGVARSEIEEIVGGLPSNMALCPNTTTATANTLWVREWASGHVSADKGDADYTVTVGDPNIIRFDTALGAARTVTLPHSSNSEDIFNGLSYTVERTGGGAFALTIQDAAGPTTLATIASGQIGRITFAYFRFGWRIIAYHVA